MSFNWSSTHFNPGEFDAKTCNRDEIYIYVSVKDEISSQPEKQLGSIHILSQTSIRIYQNVQITCFKTFNPDEELLDKSQKEIQLREWLKR